MLPWQSFLFKSTHQFAWFIIEHRKYRYAKVANQWLMRTHRTTHLWNWRHIINHICRLSSVFRYVKLRIYILMLRIMIATCLASLSIHNSKFIASVIHSSECVVEYRKYPIFSRTCHLWQIEIITARWQHGFCICDAVSHRCFWNVTLVELKKKEKKRKYQHWYTLHRQS